MCLSALSNAERGRTAAPWGAGKDWERPRRRENAHAWISHSYKSLYHHPSSSPPSSSLSSSPFLSSPPGVLQPSSWSRKALQQHKLLLSHCSTSLQSTGDYTGWSPCIRWITPTWTHTTPAWQQWKRRPTRISALAARRAPFSTTRSGAARSPTRAVPRSARPAARWEPCESTSPLLIHQVGPRRSCLNYRNLTVF